MTDDAALSKVYTESIRTNFLKKCAPYREANSKVVFLFNH